MRYFFVFCVVMYTCCTPDALALSGPEDAPYPIEHKQRVTQVDIRYKPPPKQHRKWWLKPSRYKAEKHHVLPGKTIIDPRAPLQIPKEKSLWDYPYKVSAVGAEPPKYLVGLVETSDDYRAPVTKVEVRDLPPIINASIGGVAGTLAGGAAIGLLISWSLFRRRKLTRLIRRIWNGYYDTIERVVNFAPTLVRSARARRANHSRRDGTRDQRSHQAEGVLPEFLRRADHKGRARLIAQVRHNPEDDSALGAWARRLQAIEQRQ